MLDFSLEITQGSTITFRLLVKNHSSQDQLFNFRSSQEVDFAVEHEGQEVWRWSRNRAFALLLREKNLRGGQALSPYEVKWLLQDSKGNQVPSGRYLVKAYFLGVSKTSAVAQREFLLN